MLTYQLHTRIFRIENGEPFQFPNKALLQIKFAPGSAFGTDDKPSRTLVRAHEATVYIDANTGRWLGQSRPPLERLEVLVESPTSRLSLNGNELEYEFQCSSIEELEGTLSAFRWVLPPLLNLEFSDPPVVEYARGQVGQTVFRWEHKSEEWRVHMRMVSRDKLEQHFASAFDCLELFNSTQNHRLAAALSYFHVAVRLSVSGDSPWEFMSESILNYAKCLDILFVTSENSRDDVRRALASLGYSEQEIEGDFVPILILRSWVDVAHPGVAIYKSRDLRVLYRYLALAEDRFRELLHRVLDKVRNGSFALAQSTNLELDSEEQKDMERLVTQMETRLGVIKDTLSGT